MNIIDAIKDENLFRPFLGEKLTSWMNWLAALRVVYGLKVPGRRQEHVRHCTGRQPARLPKDGFDTALFLTGRRSGKSRMAAVIGAYEAALAGHEHKLSKGEMGMVAIVSPTKKQSRLVTSYLRAIFDTPMLRQEVVGETREGFELRNGTLIEIMAGDWRTVRGYTLLAAIVDEVAFMGYDSESKVKSDTELIRAIRPSLATVGGKLIGISSPYAKKGWTYTTYRQNYGNDTGRVLVWNCPSRTMNPMLPQSVVDEALAEDLQAAKSEYLGEFRDDVCEFLPRTVVEALVVLDRRELLPRPQINYVAFVDVSGGRSDDAALAIAHRDSVVLNHRDMMAGNYGQPLTAVRWDNKRKIVIDRIFRYRPPFNPNEVIAQMAEELRRYNIRRVTGDNYAAEFVAKAFESQGIRYQKSEKPKSQLYLELLPRLCSGEVELPDDEGLINQIASLERRTRSGGRDIIDHSPGQHDDLANVVAGVVEVASMKRRVVGAIG